MNVIEMHNISLPLVPSGQLDQDEAFFVLREGGRDTRIRFHDYATIYRRPGLYEQLFYQRLRCQSPAKAAEVLRKVLSDNGQELSCMRVLDLGAGNGMVGEQLDVARMVGVDIIEDARLACERDRPHAYDAYYVTDMAALAPDMARQLRQWSFDCMTCIAALGFGDIPVPAFANAFNLIVDDGWTVFNIKETFMQQSDVSGFSKLIKHLLLSDTLEVHHLERYRHRVSIDGHPLFYYVLAGRKRAGIPVEVIEASSRAN